jgi:hypothetical protein
MSKQSEVSSGFSFFTTIRVESLMVGSGAKATVVKVFR